MSTDEMRVRVEDYDSPETDEISSDPDFDLDMPDCDFCDDHGCETCCPDEFAEMHLKWVCEGSSTIQEAIENLNEFIKDLQEYKRDGFELQEPVDNSHFWLTKDDQSSSSS